MKKGWSAILALCLLGALPACGVPASPAASETPSAPPPATVTPTVAPKPTLRPTPIGDGPAPERTLLPAPTAEIVDTAGLHMGLRDTVPPGGYSFQVPPDLYFNVADSQAAFFNADRTVELFLSGDAYSLYGTYDDMIKRYLDSFFEGSQGQYNVLSSHAFSAAGKEGWISELEVKWGGMPMEGEAVVLKVAAHQNMFALGFGRKSFGKGLHPWSEPGHLSFHALLNSLTFLPVTDVMEDQCPLARDPTYGYEKDNAVQIGGMNAKGPEREKVFLENLRGATGEKISYYRKGYVDTRSGTVDIFDVTVGGRKVVLYVNGDSYYYPQIPQGFTCSRPIKLKAP